MRALIFANGVIQNPQSIPPLIQPGDLLIAADGGGEHLLSLGLTPHLIIGDLDSLAPDTLEVFHQAGAEVLRYPMQKDETDLELALRWAVERQPSEILLFGMLGGRWDMTLANLLILANPLLAGQSCRVLDGPQEMFLLRGGDVRCITGTPGDLVSVIPVGGDVQGLTYRGLAYPLDSATLPLGSPRGVSNLLVETEACISLASGLLLCIVIRNHNVPMEVI